MTARGGLNLLFYPPVLLAPPPVRIVIFAFLFISLDCLLS